MHKKLLAGLGAVALSVTMAVGTVAPAQAAPPTGSSARQLATADALQIVGAAVTNTAGQTVGTFTGSYTPTGFTSQGGVLTVTGDLVGEVRDTAGNLLQTVNLQDITTTVLDATAQQACQILNLDLGPLHLDLLGLVIDLSEVNLDITAVPGPGNLLGNLLCAVAGLLDRNGGGLGNLLNRLLGL